MALVDPEKFDDEEVAMIYIVGRLSEGKRVEQVLSDTGIDYTVDTERFRTYVLGVLPVEYEGVAFYVVASQADLCRHTLRQAGLVKGIVEEDLD
jgi:hypothetical protein